MSLPEGLRGPLTASPEPSEAVLSAFRTLRDASRAVTEARNGPREARNGAQIRLSMAVSALRTAIEGPSDPPPGVGESGSLA